MFTLSQIEATVDIRRDEDPMKAIFRISPPPKLTPMDSSQAMRLAMSEAYKGATKASPNPLVGAVVLDESGRFLASGYHEFYGGPHAEVNAVKGLSAEELKKATIYVTLEPCAHEGKTPSCAKMLASLPVKKVVYGLIDPNPLVAGQGLEILRRAGVVVEKFCASEPEEQAEFEEALEEVCEIFLWNYRHKKVFVTLKMASSLDGQIALRSGESQWITGPESREYVHYLRASYDAILVGKGTVGYDNPSLDIRHFSVAKENKVVVLDREGEFLKKYSSLKISTAHKSENVYWCVAEDVKDSVAEIVQKLPIAPRIIYVKTSVSGHLDLESILSQLYEQGIRSVMVEGGGLTASAFLEAQLVNRLYVFQAPVLMGAGGAKSWTANLRISSMSEKLTLKNPRYLTFGSDFMITGSLKG